MTHETVTDSGLVEDGELLCYCMRTGRGDFCSFVAARPEMSLEEACEATGVGMLCTSCLLNAEMAFTSAREAGETGTDTKPLARQPAVRSAFPRRGEIVDFIIRHSPRVPAPFVSRCPILTAPGVRTVLSVSNAVPATIGPRSARFRVHASVRRADGSEVHRFDASIDPGERCDFDLSEGLGESTSGDFAAGAAIVTLQAGNRGFKGTVRPHFRIVTSRASAAVHTSNAGARASTPHIYSRRRADERHYVHVQNAATRPSHIRLTLSPLGDAAPVTIERDLAPLGSALIALPALDAAFVEATVRADALQRAYFITADADLARVSVDHI